MNRVVFGKNTARFCYVKTNSGVYPPNYNANVLKKQIICSAVFNVSQIETHFDKAKESHHCVW